MPYYLRKCLKLYVQQIRKLSRYLLLTVNVSSQGFVSVLNSIISLQDPVQCLKSLFRVHSGRFLSYLKKRKIGQNDHLLSLVIIRCHLLSLIAIRYYSLSFVVTRCHSLSLVIPLVLTRLLLVVIRYYSLSFVVTCCTTRCHSIYHSFVFL